MIVFKVMEWSNIFSYGSKNRIDFSATPLTQILGQNGHGKSSIALILEEALYGKNSKGLKRSEILNRYTDAKSYEISLDFDRDADKYHIDYKRTGAAQVLKLTKNNEDISSHTATGTFKTIESILGYDHKTFSQLIYQSSSRSLEFLTATDSLRKKFLINLLNLDHYTELGETLKESLKEVNTELVASGASINTITAWLIKLEKEDLTHHPLVDVPPEPDSSELTLLKQQLFTVEADAKLIQKNNTYLDVLDKLFLDTSTVEPPPNDLNTQIANKRAEITQLEPKTKKVPPAVITHCDKCKQPIDASAALEMSKEITAKVEEAKAKLLVLRAELNEIHLKDTEYQGKVDAFKRAQTNNQEYEKYSALYNPKLTSIVPNASDLSSRIENLQRTITQELSEIGKARVHNTASEKHNAKVESLLEQRAGYTEELSKLKIQKLGLEERASNLTILVKVFSVSGLVSYKIENLVKDLEVLTNEYLVALSDGRFSLSFTVNTSDKLLVVINDNGNDIDISALSTGELARVNTATLLGIRRLLQAISGSRTNLLILDETISSLDPVGKERLVEVLLEENNLNTFIVAHDWENPLVEKITVVKNNNISEVVNG